MFKITHMIHINMVCSDLKKSMEFYGDKLGGVADRTYQQAVERMRPPSEISGQNWRLGGPSQSMAAYIRFGDKFDDHTTMINLLQRIKPRPATGKAITTYEQIGISRVAFHVDNVNAAYKKLSSQGVEFFSPPHAANPFPGTPSIKGCSCHGPDGEIISVIQHPPGYKSAFPDKMAEIGAQPYVFGPAKEETDIFKVTHIIHTNIVVSNLERSLEFYVDKLGGVPDRPRKVALETRRPPSVEMQKVQRLSAPSQAIGTFVRFGDIFDDHTTVVELLQRLSPPATGKAISTFDRIGFFRLALHVDNPDEAYKELMSKGIEFFAPSAHESSYNPTIRGCSCHGPDGEVISLAQHLPGFRSHFPDKMEDIGIKPLTFKW